MRIEGVDNWRYYLHMLMVFLHDTVAHVDHGASVTASTISGLSSGTIGYAFRLSQFSALLGWNTLPVTEEYSQLRPNPFGLNTREG